jgi:hypothetical protein
MMLRRLLLISIGAWMSCLAMSCSPPPSVEQQVINVIKEMEKRVEAGERRAFIAHVAQEFAGQDGMMTRDELNAMVLLQLNRHRQLQVQLFPIQVTPTMPGEAEAHFRVLVTGGPGWLPDSGQMFAVETRWQGQDGDWLLVTARWQAVRVEDVLQ